MAALIRIGDRGFTRGPWKPAGQIRVGEESVDATSSGQWIDGDAEVKVVGGNMDRVLVRPVLGNQTRLGNHGQPLTAWPQESTESLEAPPAWVERINPVKIGFIAGVMIGLVVWLQGEPLSLSTVSVPVAGAISGWVFRRLVAIPAEAAGPRSDHRLLARMTAVGVCLATMIGAIIGYSASGTFLVTSLGLIAGSVTAGIIIALLFASELQNKWPEA